MSQIPDQIQITHEEVMAAMRVAVKLDVRCPIRPGEPGGFSPIAEMQLEEILQAAFNYRNERFNRVLRQEHVRLQTLVAAHRAELAELPSPQHNAQMRAEVRYLLKVIDEMTELGRTIRAYNTVRDMLAQAPSDDEDDEFEFED